MNDAIENSSGAAGDMSEYLQIYLDETEEQLDDLVETMLALEKEPANRNDLNEAFRLIHSIKGSAGMMGFNPVMVLTHHLESRFERFRSGVARLDEPTMNLVLRCIDYLRQSNNCLRESDALPSPGELLEALAALEELSIEDDSDASATASEPGSEPARGRDDDGIASLVRLVVRFRAGLPLADLKAQLVVARLSNLGEVKSTFPILEGLADHEDLDLIEVLIETHVDTERLRAAVDVEGVVSVEFPDDAESVSRPAVGDVLSHRSDNEPSAAGDAADEAGQVVEQVHESDGPPEAERAQALSSTSAQGAVDHKTAAKVAETMRVDIDRLDNLMNLAGQLVVNRARFVQISSQISPELRKASMLNRVREFSDGLRRTIEVLEIAGDQGGDWSTQIVQLRAGLELMEEQSDIWDNGSQCFGQIDEAIDQLSRVSHGLQRGVLGIRMVPVGPLFSRFKRVVRDLAQEEGKSVALDIRGEKTELDKRMVDELGDPLVHLIRNSIDHGLEGPDVRLSRGKPEAGTIRLEASHSGNNVYIQVSDDGGGIDVGKIKSRLVTRGLLTESAAEALGDEQALDYIWHAGFSTAREVTGISGRGVGMDVVKTRIGQLNGTIEVDSVPGRGTSFTIRLPLTLAIINSLLVRLRGVVFSVPVDDVREIVSVDRCNVVTVNNKQTFDVRGEFIPLVGINDVFQWHGVDYGHRRAKRSADFEAADGAVDVVVLQVAGKTMGLSVDELMGSQDIVIKSLSDNFVHVPGLSGASILGDGSVCLMLDVNAIIDMATKSSWAIDNEELSA